MLTAKATTITEEEFEVMMEAKAKPILVDFYADWWVEPGPSEA